MEAAPQDTIKQAWSCASKQLSGIGVDEAERCDWASIKMYIKADIEWT